VNKKDSYDVTPLFIASQEGHVGVVRLLLDKGARMDKPNKNGTTPLFIASQGGYVDIVRLLLDNGARVDKAMNDGGTPLMIASYRGHLKIVRLLIDNGAQADKVSNKGYTALSLAKKKGHNEIVKLLKDHILSNSTLSIRMAASETAAPKSGLDQLEEWDFLAVRGEDKHSFVVKIRKDSITRVKNNIYSAWVLYDFGVMKIRPGEKVIVQTLFLNEYNCSAKRARTLERRNRNIQVPYTYDPFAVGESIKPGDRKWKNIKPGSLDEKAMNYICGKGSKGYMKTK
jgi:predicted LPLAT superfamily acyltransferase